MKTQKLNYEVLTEENLKPQKTNEIQKLFKDVSLKPLNIKSKHTQKNVSSVTSSVNNV